MNFTAEQEIILISHIMKTETPGRKAHILLLSALVLFPGHLISQTETITLRECYEKAIASSPVAGKNILLEEMVQLTDQNIKSLWYPGNELNGSIIYNTAVADLSSITGSLMPAGLSMPVMPHDQYRITLNISQTIYDGGEIKNRRATEQIAGSYRLKERDAELYAIRSDVNTIFFALLQTKKEKELANIYLETIRARLLSAASGLENGLLLRSDYDILRAEEIKGLQRISAAATRTRALLAALNQLTGVEYSPEAEIEIPVTGVDSGDREITITRPELQLFDLRRNQLESLSATIKSERLPRAFGYATLGYGSPPGNDLFNNSFEPYALLGAGIKWSITDWKRSSRNIRINELTGSITTLEKQKTLEAIERALIIKKAEIESLEESLKSQQQVIDIRRSVTISAERQLTEGTITSTAYLTELNAEQEAILQYEINNIALVRARIEYLFLAGKEL
jgi:outer membrane protein TolC